MTPRSQPMSSVTIATLVGLSGVAPLAGCSLDRLGHKDVATVLQHYVDEAPAAGMRYGHLPGVSVNALESPAQPGHVADDIADAPGDSTLRNLLMVALRDNPDIQTAEEEARTAVERIARVTALPDPTVSGKWLPEPVRKAEGDNPFMVAIRQPFPIPQKLDRASRLRHHHAALRLA